MRKVSSALFLLLAALTPAVSLAQAPAAAASASAAAPASAVTAPVAAPTTPPDYSGTYVLDSAQSDQGQMVPQKMTMTIAQTPASFVVDRAQTSQMGETAAKFTYTLDGVPSKNHLSAGGNTVDVSTVVSWEAESPVFTSAMKFGENEAKAVEKWALSEGGKKLTVNRSVNVAGQEFSSRIVLLKQ